MFSELKMIETATGLSFNDENGILSGRKNGVAVMVFDNVSKHRFDIICGATLSDNRIEDLYALTESFPKNTVLGIENIDGNLRIYCDSFKLMQENLPLLIDFLEKLTLYASKNKLNLSEPDVSKILSLENYIVIKKKTSSQTKNKNKKQKESFDVKSAMKGLLGGFIGLLVGSSIFVVFILLSDMIGWIGGVVMAAAVISLYSAFSKKMKTFDVVASGIFVLIGWFFSNTFAYLFKIFQIENEAGGNVNIFGIINNLNLYLSKHSDIANLMSNELFVSLVFVVAGAIGSYWFYYRHNEKDQY